MKKSIIILMTLLACNFFASAQVEKGKWFVAGYGDVNFDIGKEKSKSGGTTSDHYKYFDFDFNPMIGKFVVNKLPVGLFFDSYYYSFTEEDYKETETQFIVGPFVRYYILEKNKFFPYAEGRLGLGLWRSKESDYDPYKESYFATELGVGTSYFFADNLALDALLGYGHSTWTHKNEDTGGGVKSTMSDDTKYIYSGIIFKLGIVVTFGKE